MSGVHIYETHHPYEYRQWTNDDSYISFRYALNLVEGNGLVYNVGERVEGYTCFLWVLLLAGTQWALQTAGLAPESITDSIEQISHWWGLVLCWGTLALISQAWRFVPKLAPQVCCAAVVLVGATGSVNAWSMTGKEVALNGFVLLLAFLVYARARATLKQSTFVWAGVLASLAVMARPDFLLLTFILFGDSLLLSIRTRERHYIDYTLSALMILLFYTAFKLWYYGQIIPNTYYAKVGYSEEQFQMGLVYVENFLGAHLPLLPALLAPFILRRPLLNTHPATLIACFAALYGVYTMKVGGDQMPAFRLLATLVPLLGIGAAMVVLSHGRDFARTAAFVGIALAFGDVTWRAHPELARRIHDVTDTVRWKEIGLAMKELFPPETVLAINAAGAIPYYTGFITIDMLGLTDPRIARRDLPMVGLQGHMKGDGKYVLDLEPHVIMLGPPPGLARPNTLISDKEIRKDDRLKFDYRLRKYILAPDLEMVVYLRRDFMNGLKDRGYSYDNIGT